MRCRLKYKTPFLLDKYNSNPLRGVVGKNIEPPVHKSNFVDKPSGGKNRFGISASIHMFIVLCVENRLFNPTQHEILLFFYVINVRGLKL